jgi:hypothetical protein
MVKTTIFFHGLSWPISDLYNLYLDGPWLTDVNCLVPRSLLITHN